jgi:hypothetical protein
MAEEGPNRDRYDAPIDERLSETSHKNHTQNPKTLYKNEQGAYELRIDMLKLETSPGLKTFLTLWKNEDAISQEFFRLCEL